MSPPTPQLNQFGLKDLRGVKFGMLTVAKLEAKDPESGKWRWTCVCDCGVVLVVRHDYLIHTNSPKTHCGCANKGPSVLRPLEYAVWSMMHVRCTDPGHVAWHHYGGRGIKVCERWTGLPEGFENFCADMGPRRDRSWSIERQDPNGGYEPSNCVWLKKKFQGRNKRGSIKLPHPMTGVMVPAAEVAEYLKISYQVMRARYMADGLWPTSKPEATHEVIIPPGNVNSKVDVDVVTTDGTDCD